MLNSKLRECRERCEFSQQQVADCLNIDRSTYSYYEAGRTEPSIENLKKLARLFGVSILELLEIESPVASEITLNDPGIEAQQRIDEQVGIKVGDLTKEEQRLILRFRMLTSAQRADIILAMCIADAPEE